MGKRDRNRGGLLTCSEVCDRLYPFLLRATSEPERAAIVLHVDGCDGCRISLAAVHSRLQRIAGVPEPEPDPRPRERVPARRRLWLSLLPVVPAALAFALLIQQGIQIARYHYEWRFKDRLERAIWRFHEERGEFPAAGAPGVPLSRALSGPDKSGRPYVDLGREAVDGAGNFLDRWGNRWQYVAPGQHNPWMFDLQSFGSNGRDDRGRHDDIANWED